MLLIYIRGYVVIIRILKKKNPPLQLDHKSRYTEPLKFSGYFYNTIKAVSIESTRFSIVPRTILSKIAIRIDRERERGGEKREREKRTPSSFQLRIYQRVYQRNKPPHSNVKYTLLVEIRANRDNVENTLENGGSISGFTPDGNFRRRGKIIDGKK